MPPLRGWVGDAVLNCEGASRWINFAAPVFYDRAAEVDLVAAVDDALAYLGVRRLAAAFAQEWNGGKRMGVGTWRVSGG
jgi:hypothetical protein